VLNKFCQFKLVTHLSLPSYPILFPYYIYIVSSIEVMV